MQFTETFRNISLENFVCVFESYNFIIIFFCNKKK